MCVCMGISDPSEVLSVEAQNGCNPVIIAFYSTLVIFDRQACRADALKKR